MSKINTFFCICILLNAILPVFSFKKSAILFAMMSKESLW